MKNRSIFRTALAASAMMATLTMAPRAQAEALLPPFAAPLPSGTVAASKLASCAAAPQPVLQLATLSRYQEEDATKSTIDPARAKAYEAAVKPLRDYQSEIVGWANDVVKKPKKLDKAGCALVWLDAWAKANALSQLSTGQSEFNRDQALASLGLAYLQIKDVSTEGRDIRPAIQTWLRKLAADVMAYYETKAGTMSRANNHRYFAAVGVGAAGIALEDRALFEWAMRTFADAVCGAEPSGALPMEMQRGSRARDYQIFAAGPLVILAEMAAANGLESYEKCDRGLHRIIDFGLGALDDPAPVEKLAGQAQVDFPEVAKRGSRLAWLIPYVRRYPQTRWAALLDGVKYLSSTALGGNQEILFPTERPAD